MHIYMPTHPHTYLHVTYLYTYIDPHTRTYLHTCTHTHMHTYRQAVHHLFPQVGWGHYAQLAPIVATVCAKHGVVYTTQPTFWAALRAHLSHLSRVNSGVEADVWVPPSMEGLPEATLSALAIANANTLRQRRTQRRPDSTSAGRWG